MKRRTTILVIALATMLVTAGAAVAAPGNAPAHAGNADNASDEHDDAADDDEQDDDIETEEDDERDENATESDEIDDAEAENYADHDENASAVPNGERSSDAQGPPAELPEQVPDHVSQIHDLIRQFLDGDYDGSLGDAVSSVTPNDQPGEASQVE